MAYPVEIIRSAKRKKTVAARLVRGVIEVRVPARLSEVEVQRHTAALVAKIERQTASESVDLEVLAASLAERYDVPVPETIRWVSNQAHRWGSCTMADRSVRISDRLGDVPRFVLEYVVLHELTHLVEADHGPAFKELMARYPKAERAEGYLMALGRH